MAVDLRALTRGRGSREAEGRGEQHIRRRGKQSRHSGGGGAVVENERERERERERRGSAGGGRDQEFDEAMPEIGTSPSSSSKIWSWSSSLAHEIVGARAVATLNTFG